MQQIYKRTSIPKCDCNKITVEPNLIKLGCSINLQFIFPFTRTSRETTSRFTVVKRDTPVPCVNSLHDTLSIFQNCYPESF